MAEKTYHEGAEAERKAFKAYLKRQLKNGKGPFVLTNVLRWVQARCDRYRKRKGGL